MSSAEVLVQVGGAAGARDEQEVGAWARSQARPTRLGVAPARTGRAGGRAR